MLFLSPPFGNYISLPYCKSIKGSYTLEERPGILKQVYKTLYYDYVLDGWVNKIGLRNKGIDYGIKNYNEKTDIISIAILNEDDIEKINNKLDKKTNIEINVSCPNIDKQLINNKINKLINKEREWCIIKCGPLTTNNQLDEYYNAGFRQFHFCNTLPVKNGGLSGKSLIPYTKSLTNHIKNNYNDCVLINGGGIQNYNDIKNYNIADHHSVSTVMFNPFKFGLLYANYIFKHLSS